MELEVHNAIIILDPKKSAGPDHLKPYFFKLAVDFIAPPLTYLFNLSLDISEIPLVWKSAYLLPLFNGGDEREMNNYKPISKLSAMAKVQETSVCEKLKDLLTANNILSNVQSDFRKKHTLQHQL